MTPHELLDRAGRAATLAEAGASHARITLNALERIAEDMLAVYHDVRHNITEDNAMKQRQELVESTLTAYEAAIEAAHEYDKKLHAADDAVRALLKETPELQRRLFDRFIDWAPSGPAAISRHRSNVAKIRALLTEKAAA